jgi:hypothetical protein
MVSQFAGGQGIATFPGHDAATVAHEHSPTGVTNLQYIEPITLR